MNFTKELGNPFYAFGHEVYVDPRYTHYHVYQPQVVKALGCTLEGLEKYTDFAGFKAFALTKKDEIDKDVNKAIAEYAEDNHNEFIPQLIAFDEFLEAVQNMLDTKKLTPEIFAEVCKQLSAEKGHDKDPYYLSIDFLDFGRKVHPLN